jgi:hypothetical protein
MRPLLWKSWAQWGGTFAFKMKNGRSISRPSRAFRCMFAARTRISMSSGQIARGS